VGLSGRNLISTLRTYAKTDHYLGKHVLSFSYEDAPRNDNLTTPAPGFEKVDNVTNFDARNFRVRLSDTWSVKPNLILTTRVATNQAPRIWGSYSEPVGTAGKGILKGA